MISRFAFGLSLVVVWVLAWGELSFANILAGSAVAVLLLAVAPDTWPARPEGRVRPIAVLRFVGYTIVKAFESNLVIARGVVSRESRLHTGVVAVPVPDCADELITLVANVMALTPGLMTIEVDTDPIVLYVHVFNVVDIETSRRDINRLTELAFAAFAPDETVRELRARLEAAAS